MILTEFCRYYVSAVSWLWIRVSIDRLGVFMRGSLVSRSMNNSSLCMEQTQTDTFASGHCNCVRAGNPNMTRTRFVLRRISSVCLTALSFYSRAKGQGSIQPAHSLNTNDRPRHGITAKPHGSAHCSRNVKRSAFYTPRHLAYPPHA
jgi:hypothetical protein